MDNFRRELRRGTIELILLKLLEKEDMYGYEIVASLAKRGGEIFSIKEGTLYPVLYRLEDKRFIDSYRSNPKRGVPRKYYKLTDRGRDHLELLLKEWGRFAGIINDLISSGGDKNE